MENEPVVALIRAGGSHYHLDLMCPMIQDPYLKYSTKPLVEIIQLKKFNPCKCADKNKKRRNQDG